MKRTMILITAVILIIMIAATPSLADYWIPEEPIPYIHTKAAFREIGEKIADLQNRYLYISDSDEVRTNAETISTYFDSHDSSWLARTPWFCIEGYTWTFHLPEISYTKVNCGLWLCRNDETGEVVAYATGYYEGGFFTDVEWYVLYPALDILTDPSGSYDVTPGEYSGMYG